MDSAFNRFQNNLISVKALNHIYNYLSTKKVDSIDLSELLRAEYVLIVSAFDSLIHDLIRIGILKIFDNEKSEKDLNNFSIPLQVAKELISSKKNEERNRLLNAQIRKITTKDSYQSPKSIEYALQLLSVKKIWMQVSNDINIQADEIRKKLGIIVDRRNKIAHEADWNYSDDRKLEINKDDIDNVYDFITKLSESIFKIVKNEVTNANNVYKSLDDM